jgi:hypothetical protein
VELGILSLGDLQRDQRTGCPQRAVDRMTEILGYAVLADQLGLDVFAVGEHHSAGFFTSFPAVVLAAAAARTSQIRLTSATTVLGVADPVRVKRDQRSLWRLNALHELGHAARLASPASSSTTDPGAPRRRRHLRHPRDAGRAFQHRDPCRARRSASGPSGSLRMTVRPGRSSLVMQVRSLGCTT